MAPKDPRSIFDDSIDEDNGEAQEIVMLEDIRRQQLLNFNNPGRLQVGVENLPLMANNPDNMPQQPPRQEPDSHDFSGSNIAVEHRASIEYFSMILPNGSLTYVPSLVYRPIFEHRWQHPVLDGFRTSRVEDYGLGSRGTSSVTVDNLSANTEAGASSGNVFHAMFLPTYLSGSRNAERPDISSSRRPDFSNLSDGVNNRTLQTEHIGQPSTDCTGPNINSNDFRQNLRTSYPNSHFNNEFPTHENYVQASGDNVRSNIDVANLIQQNFGHQAPPDGINNEAEYNASNSIARHNIGFILTSSGQYAYAHPLFPEALLCYTSYSPSCPSQPVMRHQPPNITFYYSYSPVPRGNQHNMENVQNERSLTPPNRNVPPASNPSTFYSPTGQELFFPLHRPVPPNLQSVPDPQNCTIENIPHHQTPLHARFAPDIETLFNPQRVPDVPNFSMPQNIPAYNPNIQNPSAYCCDCQGPPPYNPNPQPQPHNFNPQPQPYNFNPQPQPFNPNRQYASPSNPNIQFPAYSSYPNYPRPNTSSFPYNRTGQYIPTRQYPQRPQYTPSPQYTQYAPNSQYTTTQHTHHTREQYIRFNVNALNRPPTYNSNPPHVPYNPQYPQNLSMPHHRVQSPNRAPFIPRNRAPNYPPPRRPSRNFNRNHHQRSVSHSPRRLDSTSEHILFNFTRELANMASTFDYLSPPERTPSSSNMAESNSDGEDAPCCGTDCCETSCCTHLDCRKKDRPSDDNATQTKNSDSERTPCCPNTCCPTSCCRHETCNKKQPPGPDPPSTGNNNAIRSSSPLNESPNHSQDPILNVKSTNDNSTGAASQDNRNTNKLPEEQISTTDNSAKGTSQGNRTFRSTNKSRNQSQAQINKKALEKSNMLRRIREITQQAKNLVVTPRKIYRKTDSPNPFIIHVGSDSSSSEELSSAEEEPARAEKEPARTEQEPARTEQEPACAEEEPARAEKEPARTEQEPARTEQEPACAEEEPARTERPITPMNSDILAHVLPFNPVSEESLLPLNLRRLLPIPISVIKSEIPTPFRMVTKPRRPPRVFMEFNSDDASAIHKKMEVEVIVKTPPQMVLVDFLTHKALNKFPQNVTVNSKGNIFLEFGSTISVEITRSYGLRMSCSQQKVAMAISAIGTHVGIFHTHGSFYNCDDEINIQVPYEDHISRLAKITRDGRCFFMNTQTVHMFELTELDLKQIRRKGFLDMANDFTKRIILCEGLSGRSEADHCLNIIERNSIIEIGEDKDQMKIGHIQIAQSVQGTITLVKDNVRLQICPLNGCCRINTPSYSVKVHPKIGVINFSFEDKMFRILNFAKSFIVRCKDQSAGFDNMNHLQQKFGKLSLEPSKKFK